MEWHKMEKRLTVEDVDACWSEYCKDYLVEILNGEYDWRVARNDLRSLVNSKHDIRCATKQ